MLKVGALGKGRAARCRWEARARRSLGQALLEHAKREHALAAEPEELGRLFREEN